ncbi:MAG: translesion DNA synthesis-associated protein ImuA [Gammaproteobacteria bacterium]|nr:translesion DNA synthesis-associated protein ImuA [Gammaproteobacteria bacterium]
MLLFFTVSVLVSDVDKALKSLLQNNPGIWCGGESIKKYPQGLPTGFDALDNILPTHGWPTNALIEVLLPRWGIGELQLLLPVIVAMSQHPKWVAWISPPFVPYAPALVYAGVDIEHLVVIPKEESKAESLWAMEKILRNKSCGIAMSWPQKINDKAMRRLQLAAEEGGSLGFVFRDYQVVSSPAALRISLSIINHQLQVTLLKARGASRGQSILLDLPIL